MSAASNSLFDTLQTRSQALSKVRQFFAARHYQEVDPPALSTHCNLDLHIQPFHIPEEDLYLFTSPEHFMKDLLSRGSGPIYFLGHVFRKEEVGSLHNAEFTMIEWYKPTTTENAFIQETLDLFALFLGKQPLETLSYTEALKRYAKSKTHWDPITHRHYVWAHDVEPQLGQQGITLIHSFLPEEAQLAQTGKDTQGNIVALRYEFYYKGIELANGYLECSDCQEIKNRFTMTNTLRAERGHSPLPLDALLLEALAKGLPPETYGIAVGFDRLLMLQEGQKTLSAVVPYTA